jgi:hypothetical protein
MIIKAINRGVPPPGVRAYLQLEPLVTFGKEYEAHAISVFKGIVAFQVVADAEIISWQPAWLFEVIDATLPDDWVCQVFLGDLSLLMGPEFIAKSKQDYHEMVEHYPKQVQRFWDRLKKRGALVSPLGKAQRYLDAIRRALLKEWDPINVGDLPEGENEYDPYINKIYTLLTTRATRQQLFDYLWWVETEHLGLVGKRQATERFAERLLRLPDETAL